MNQIYPQAWISLSKATRHRLAAVFGLKPTGISEIRDQDVVSDGFTAEDLKGITLEKMNKYIGSVETFGRAWEITLAKVHSELNPPIGEIKQANGEPTIVDIVPPVEPVSVPEVPPVETVSVPEVPPVETVSVPEVPPVETIVPNLQAPIVSGTARNKSANGK